MPSGIEVSFTRLNRNRMLLLGVMGLGASALWQLAGCGGPATPVGDPHTECASFGTEEEIDNAIAGTEAAALSGVPRNEAYSGILSDLIEDFGADDPQTELCARSLVERAYD
jgi:hypothetical protein